jgi:prefoldin alpha subunit
MSSELEHLSNSYQRLRAAQIRFKDCIRSIQDGVENKTAGMRFQNLLTQEVRDRILTTPPETPLLIPLTPSLYIPARPSTLSSPVTVLVDIGTGFYVEKTTGEARKFYDKKIEDLTKNLGQIEDVVRQKTDTLRSVEDVMRRKVVEGQQQGGQGGGAGGGGGPVK